MQIVLSSETESRGSESSSDMNGDSHLSAHTRVRQVFVLAIAALVVLSGAIGAALALTHDGHPRAVDTMAARERCRPWRVFRVYYRDGQGRTHPKEDAPGLATVQQLTDDKGSIATEVIPPAGFRPLTASNEELRAFGFQTRPSDSRELASWTLAYSHYKRTLSGLCGPAGFTAVSNAG